MVGKGFKNKLLLAAVLLIIFNINIVFSAEALNQTGEDMDSDQNVDNSQFFGEIYGDDVAVSDSSFIAINLKNGRVPSCSPRIPDSEWLGVKIKMPKIAFYGQYDENKLVGFNVIPLCGVNTFKSSDIDTSKPQVLVVIDKETGDKASGFIVELDPSPVAPYPSALKKIIDSKKKEPKPIPEYETYTSEYFNINIQDYIKLPEKEATYLIHVEENGYKSNVVELKVEKFSQN